MSDVSLNLLRKDLKPETCPDHCLHPRIQFFKRRKWPFYCCKCLAIVRIYWQEPK